MTKGGSNSDRPTNCLRVLDFENRDFGDLYQVAVALPGFVRVTFHKEKECHIAFSTLQQSKAGLDWLSRNAGQVNVFYAPPQPQGSMTQTAEPSSVLYVRLMHGMNTPSLQKIVEDYEGLEMMKPAENHVKLFFASVESASAGSERLFRETNIYAFFHHGCGPGGSPNNLPGGPRTLHVTKLDRDMADLRAYLSDRLPCLERIGFHDGYVFCCFLDHESAKTGRKMILNETRMKARLVEFQYVPHFQPTPLGTVGTTVRLDYNTIKPTGDEMLKFFGPYPGFAHIETRDKCCFASFRTPQQARAALEDLNNTTNLKAVYRSRESAGSGSSNANRRGVMQATASSTTITAPSQLAQRRPPSSTSMQSSSSVSTAVSSRPRSRSESETNSGASTPTRNLKKSLTAISDAANPMRNFWSVLVDEFGVDSNDDLDGLTGDLLASAEYQGPISQQLDDDDHHYHGDDDEDLSNNHYSQNDEYFKTVRMANGHSNGIGATSNGKLGPISPYSSSLPALPSPLSFAATAAATASKASRILGAGSNKVASSTSQSVKPHNNSYNGTKDSSAKVSKPINTSSNSSLNSNIASSFHNSVTASTAYTYDDDNYVPGAAPRPIRRRSRHNSNLPSI
ncbi:hypothetical protein SmJEL517_g04107 [Synchytrium microbalum]|uniref:RRM domain-containing protein n=1 Tax=Synchytrium microbalum TaxID=1806994 RepID=A0A507C416_9FUNG|nr:uncharacterized protein SmJEL517_g04107 [Synchytrium microbalum]TPX32854.1 hypothetical protein SmJEL517_g04107 [Synchytrium microbalum]